MTKYQSADMVLALTEALKKFPGWNLNVQNCINDCQALCKSSGNDCGILCVSLAAPRR